MVPPYFKIEPLTQQEQDAIRANIANDPLPLPPLDDPRPKDLLDFPRIHNEDAEWEGYSLIF